MAATDGLRDLARQVHDVCLKRFTPPVPPSHPTQDNRSLCCARLQGAWHTVAARAQQPPPSASPALQMSHASYHILALAKLHHYGAAYEALRGCALVACAYK